MRTTDLILVFVVLALCAMRWCWPASGDAQDHDRLIKALVAESDGHRADDAAILHLLARRAERTGRSLDAESWAYCAIGRVRHPSERQQAILRRDVRWSRQFERATEDVRLFEAGELADPCPGSQHFGAPVGPDYRRAVRLHWRRVTCATRTFSAFWRLP